MALYRRPNSARPTGCLRRTNRLTLSLALLPCLALAACDTKQSASPSAIPSAATAPPIQPAPQAPVAAPAPTPQQRRAQQLIALAERALQSGEAHYRKGQLLAAKADFDNAVDTMLSSGLDIKADPQLNDEFNRILDSVNGLETEALKQGNGFAPNVEPTPADVANDVTFEVDPNVVAKAKEQLTTTKSDIPLVINDYVATYIKFFANSQRGHNTLKHALERSGRYKAMIQRVMTEEGVPQDLIYLAVAESGFQPRVVNAHSGAGGMWQFMPHDKYYGLASNAYVDERFDPEKSTRASAKYMKFIYDQLGDWYLAMAGYNWGTGRVQQAVQKTGYADFWELYKRNNLPEQTKNYVPEIVAAIIIAKNPHQYGFDDLEFDPAIEYDTVPINYSVDLRLVADIVNAQPQELAALNPSLMRMTTPPASLLPEPFSLHVPVGTAELFRQRIAAIPQEHRNAWRYHRVAADDTLATVAHAYRVGIDQLAAVNQLHSGDALDKVEALAIPSPPPSAPVTRTEVYRARRGDSLVKIADRFGVSLEDLHRWNHIAGNVVAAGERVRVAEPSRAAAQVSSRNASQDKSKGSSRSRVNKGDQAHDQAHAASFDSKGKRHTNTNAPTPASKSRNAQASAKDAGSKKTSTQHKSKKRKNNQK